MTPRASIYARRYTLMSTPVGDIFVPVFSDLDDDALQWHYEWGIDNEDYEYAQAAYAEGLGRGILIKV